jgi:hypothetical protein
MSARIIKVKQEFTEILDFYCLKRLSGEMAEWLKAQHWKCCVGVILPRVRIPLSPYYFNPPKSMAYSDFTLRKVKEEFGLTLVEGERFLPEILPAKITTPYLADVLKESLPLAIAMGSEKARSELLISPVLFELRRILDRKISFFSGEDFTVDPDCGLNGTCDFLISRSSEQLMIEAPAIVIVEAKKDNIKGGFGQCIAEMIAAQRFNDRANTPVRTIYGTVTTGNIWTFLKLEEKTVTIDLTDYLLLPVERLLGVLVWMMAHA